MDRYIIVNKQGRRLTGFYSNGGFEIKDVFAFSSRNWIVFNSEKEVQDKLLNMLDDCKKQEDRWGDWLDKALKFVKELKYEKI